MYQYRATVVKVHDGDTITVDLDLGFYVTMRAQVRLAGINAPELKTVEGEASTQELMRLLGGTWTTTRTKGKFGVLGNYTAIDAPVIYVETQLPNLYEKYGRVLGTLFASLDSPTSINATMVAGGFAVVYP